MEAVLNWYTNFDILVAHRKEQKGMKYQIYLNKDTSILINELAEKNNSKPNTYIKKFLEAFMRIYKASETQISKELENEYAGRIEPSNTGK